MDKKKRASDRAGRPVMRSPGRPPVGRLEHRQRFWAAIASGVSSEDAAAAAGVSAAVGVRWFREAGGMPSVTLAPASGRYLSFSEREEIALLRAGGGGVREIAREVGRSKLAVNDELRRYVQERLSGAVKRPDGAAVVGPHVPWKGSPRPSRGPAVGDVMEPGADLRPAAAGLPR